MIDVQVLKDQLTDLELIESANHYFAEMTLDSEQCHKPFSNIRDAKQINKNLALLLEAADLFRGAQVLDFGSATGWLSLSIANLGCQVIGLDIAQSALDLAQKWIHNKKLRNSGTVCFELSDGHRLPLPDASVDRIICFDSFHHARDQVQTLTEFARVLRPGGRIAMIEPGPNHSRTPQSQMEMSLYRVIEGDIDMALISEAAHSVGLDSPQMLVQLFKPISLPIEKYLAWARNRKLSRVDEQEMQKVFTQSLSDTQCFYIEKPGLCEIDSRKASALAADLRLISTRQSDHDPHEFIFDILVTNTGEASWIKRPGALGQVKLGVQLINKDKEIKNRDFRRFDLNNCSGLPGQSQLITVQLNIQDMFDYDLRFDLVAEYVAWFTDTGRTIAIDWISEIAI